MMLSSVSMLDHHWLARWRRYNIKVIKEENKKKKIRKSGKTFSSSILLKVGFLQDKIEPNYCLSPNEPRLFVVQQHAASVIPIDSELA